MSKKEKLLERIQQKPIIKNFKKIELDKLMNKCGCEKYQGGRGSGIGYKHIKSNLTVQFDEPHPGDELYVYQVKMVLQFLKDIGEID